MAWAPSLDNHRKAIRAVASSPWPVPRHTLRKAARAVYVATFSCLDREGSLKYLVKKSAMRTWWPTDGSEWRMLTAGIRFNTAHHAIKLFSGGIAGTVGRRPAKSRRVPKKCACCRSLDICWTWATPSAGNEGLAWCKDCTAPYSSDVAPWAWLLRRTGEAPP